MRAALGASRWRLVREQAIEGVMHRRGQRRRRPVARERHRPHRRRPGAVGLANSIYNSNVFDWQLDRGALTGAVMAGVIALFIAGVVPAIRLTRTHVRSALDLGTRRRRCPTGRAAAI